MKQKEKKSSSYILKRILSLTHPYRLQFRGAIALSVVLALVGPIRPKLVQKAIDVDIASKDFEALKWTVIVMIVLLVFESSIRYIFSYLAGWLGASIIKDLRTRVYDFLIASPLSYFDKTPIGTSTTRTITDVEAINDTFSEGLLSILADILIITIVIFFMFAGNVSWTAGWFGLPIPHFDFSTWKIALASLSTLPILIFVTRWFQQGVKNAYQEERSQIAKLNAFLQEHISGMRIIQIFNVQKREYEKFKDINNDLQTANIKNIWYYSLFFPAVEICVALSIGITVAVATKLILLKEVELGIIMSFILYINMLFRPLRFIADKVNTIQRGIIASDRVFQLLEQEISDEESNTGKPLQLNGRVRFQNVCFGYSKETQVLKDISFEINEGESLAIVGPTGSGKTSTIAILTKQYPMQSGQIFIDDMPISDINTKSMRSQMSIVLQDVFLFSGTIYENITLRNPEITKVEVFNAAKAIGADEFILNLPNGYDYLVMERGLALSLGQRQLISFVRALVYNPKILILDEATSSIDSATEAVVQQAIKKLITGRTSIIIAHRLSTIREATKIMVLENGEKKEFGSHDELIKKNGSYAKLWHSQFELQSAIL